MSDIKQELDKIRDRISDPDFLANKGLSNEVGIHVFCYDPADELIVRNFIFRLKAESGTPYHIKECDLYEIFLQLLEDKRVLRSVESLEEKRGKEYLMLSPTINTNAGDIARIPLVYDQNNSSSITDVVEDCILDSQEDWNSSEISWDFKRSPLV